MELRSRVVDCLGWLDPPIVSMLPKELAPAKNTTRTSPCRDEEISGIQDGRTITAIYNLRVY
jgi:hypothetical protein